MLAVIVLWTRCCNKLIEMNCCKYVVYVNNLKTIEWNWYHVQLVVIAEGYGKVVGVGIVRVVGHLTFVEDLGLIVGRTFDRSTVRWSSMFWNFDFSGKFRPEKQKETLREFLRIAHLQWKSQQQIQRLGCLHIIFDI